MGFKENLKEELTYKGMLVKDLAEKTGLNQASLSNYLRENSSIPSADIAVKIAKALNVSVEYLVSGKDRLIIEKEVFDIQIIQIAKKLSKINKDDLKHIIALIESYLT